MDTAAAPPVAEKAAPDVLAGPEQFLGEGLPTARTVASPAARVVQRLLDACRAYDARLVEDGAKDYRVKPDKLELAYNRGCIETCEILLKDLGDR